jgi:hypothetical protein
MEVRTKVIINIKHLTKLTRCRFRFGLVHLIGVSSVPGKGSDFKFYVRARRAPTPKRRETFDLAETVAKTSKQSKSQHDDQKGSDETTGLRVTHPNYIAPLNRSHSASQNPVVGSPSDANTLHVLIVEDNLINQKVRISELKDLGSC